MTNELKNQFVVESTIIDFVAVTLSRLLIRLHVTASLTQSQQQFNRG